MKKLIFYLLFIFSLDICFGESYNYYQRNELTGSYQIKNLEKVPEQYHFVYSLQDNQIIGYYYNSTIIKFIDTINENRVIKSTYFSKDPGNVLCEKEFFYGDDSEIHAFTYKQMNDKGDVVYEIKSFFSKSEDKIIYNSYVSIINEDLKNTIIQKGLLSKEYQPIELKSSGIVMYDNFKIAQTYNVEEEFFFDDFEVVLKFFQNGKLAQISRKFSDDKLSEYEEINFNENEEEIRSKKYILSDSILTQIFKTNYESINEYKYSKIDENCYLLSYEDWDNTSVIRIVTADEVVYIKNDVVENIKFPLNVFDISPF